MNTISKWAAVVAFLSGPVGAQQAATVYSNQSAFLSNVGTSITDTYSAATYGFGAFGTGNEELELTNAEMSAAFGQTTYSGIAAGGSDPNYNLVGYSSASPTFTGYCAGCNGAFTLGFTQTSVTSTGGIFGFGFDYFTSTADATATTPVTITYANGSTQNLSLNPNVYRPPAALTLAYFGITSSEPIASAFVDGNSSYIDITNLTVAAAPVPEPASVWLMLSGMGVIFVVARRRLSSGQPAA